MATSPITTSASAVASTANHSSFLKVVGWLTAVFTLMGAGYGAVYKLQIDPLEKSRAELRADIAAMQIRLDKADEAYKTLSVGMVDTRIKAAGLQVGFDGKTQVVQQCEVQLAQSQNSLAQFQRSYTMASHLIELRKQQISAERSFAFTNDSELKASYERDISNLQKQIEFATKCSY